jgi:hypothetical protein
MSMNIAGVKELSLVHSFEENRRKDMTQLNSTRSAQLVGAESVQTRACVIGLSASGGVECPIIIAVVQNEDQLDSRATINLLSY